MQAAPGRLPRAFQLGSSNQVEVLVIYADKQLVNEQNIATMEGKITYFGTCDHIENVKYHFLNLKLGSEIVK